MLRIDFGNHSRDRSPSPTSPTRRESATLSGHKLSPTAPRYALRCQPDGGLGDIVTSLHVPGCAAIQTINLLGETTLDKEKQEGVKVNQPQHSERKTSMTVSEAPGTDEEVFELSKQVVTTPDLQSLSFSYCQLGNKLDKLIQAMSAGRLTCVGLLPNLRSLNLCGNAMQDQTFNVLTTALELGGLPHLAKLDISSNRVTTLEPLARAAQTMSNNGKVLQLSVLKAEYNALNENALDSLVGATASGSLPSLNELWLAGNLLSNVSIDALARAFKSGSQIRALHLGMNRISYESKATLEQSCSHSVHIVW